jgi:hypothetical protein
MIISHMLDPATLVKLDEQQMKSLSYALQAELLNMPEVRKVIEAKLKPYAEALRKG